MKTSTKPTRVAIASVVIDRSLNVRDPKGAGYDVTNLKADLVQRGQQDPATLEKLADGTYRPVKGFRRATAILEAAKEGLIDPSTQKPFDSITAFVVEELTERERINLILDHGQRKGLDKVELFYAIERSVRAMWTEKEIVVVLRDLLELWYPPTRKIEPQTPENYLDYYRGVIQTAKRAANAPTVLRDAWVSKLRGNHAWPIKKDMETLVKLFEKEQEADKSNTISRDNPGPQFKAAWEKYLDEVEKAKEEGEARPKSISMFSADQVKKLKPASDSRILKTVVDVILREREPDVWAQLDVLLASLEKTPEIKDKLDVILGVTPQA